MLSRTTSKASTSNLINRTFCSCSTLNAVPGLKPNPGKLVPKRPYLRKYPLPLNVTLPQTELFMELNSVMPLVHRPTLINEDTCRDIVRGWGIDKMHDAVVIDAYAGPGGITRALLELKNVKRVISVEEAFRYLPKLRALQDLPENAGRLEVIPQDPFVWETYADIEKLGLLSDVPKHSWDQVHPNFFLCAQLPNTRHGEQLFLQFLTTSAGKMWLYQFGRLEMGFVGHEPFWNKIAAAVGTKGHHKLAVLIEAIAEVKRVPNLTGLIPPEMHFHKPKSDPANFAVVKVTPFLEPKVKNFDSLEYVARHMFIGKAQPWPKAVAALAAGAENLIPKLVSKGLPSGTTTVNQLEMQHWISIADVFDAWPFKPPTMFDELSFNQD